MLMLKSAATILLFALACLVILPGDAKAQREKLPPEDLEIVQKRWPEAKRTSTGLRYVITQEGEGENAKPGDLIKVLYRGSLLNGAVFDEAKDPQQPFTFRLGRGNVIEGWDQGLQLMKRGTKMVLIVPYELGYGTRGNPPKIGRRATLIFEIEMVEITRDAAPSALPSTPAPERKKK